MVRQLCTLQSGPPNISSAHLAPYIVITILFTIFPMPYFISSWLLLFCDYQFVLLNPFTFFTQSPDAPPIWHPSVWERNICRYSVSLKSIGNLTSAVSKQKIMLIEYSYWKNHFYNFILKMGHDYVEKDIYSHVPHNDVSLKEGPHVEWGSPRLQWSWKIPHCWVMS